VLQNAKNRSCARVVALPREVDTFFVDVCISKK
jgi:hypothetical protein